jgi:uncharacterized protein (DUF2062 family)
MKPCILIPCYNHPNTVAAVAQAALALAPVIIVDDGSTLPLPPLPDCEWVRLTPNAGKGAALRAGFARAQELRFTHAITMDADGQHFAADLPQFLAAAQAQPEALIVGVRDLRAAGAPGHRQCSNAVSSFWFHAETGVRLRDTQCGFRCYPLALTKILKTKSGRYAFELEFMVRASWVGTPLVPVPVKCTYEPHQLRQSHFRPVVDLARITFMNIGLVAQSWFIPRRLRTEWSYGIKTPATHTLREIFSENTEDPFRLALAIGIGLFFGIVPIWGFQMATAALVAHWLRLNKAVALIASHVSFGPAGILITSVSIILGHWLFTGEWLAWPLHWSRLGQYFWQWIVGSLVLASVTAVLGTMAAYVVARMTKAK